MSSSTRESISVEPPEEDPAPPVVDSGRPSRLSRRRLSRKRRTHGPINRAWVFTHRWVSLVLGLLLLVELLSGAILLYDSEISRALDPHRYQATASDDPVELVEALQLVRDTAPEMDAQYAYLDPDTGVYLIYGDGLDTAFVDPGSGRVLDVGESAPWVLGFLVNLHDCGFSCEGYPGYQEWLTTPMTWVSEEMTVGGFVLGALGVVLLFLTISGAIVWWPGLKGWISGFIVRRGRGPYVRDLDLHRVVGLVSVPFLFMWAFTGAAYEYQWPEKVYFALLPGEAVEESEPELVVGDGPLVSLQEAVAEVRAVQPGARVDGIYRYTPEEEGGSYGIETVDAAGGHGYLEVDSHGGGTVDFSAHEEQELTWAQEFWDSDAFYDLHFGTIVGPWWRIVWFAFGVAPVLLAVTGITIWLTKRRTKRGRRQRRRADAEPS